MDKDFKQQMEYCNIPAWHKRGYTGKGIAVFMDDVTERNHCKLTQMIVQTILPDALVLTGTIGTNISGGKVTNPTITCYETGESMPFEDFIAKYKIGLINNSKDNGTHDKDNPKAVWLRSMRDKHNLILTASAGNGYGCPIDNSYYGAGIIVTGVNTKKKSTYAEDEAIDFAAYTAGMAGTSFAAPFLCGMVGLLRCKYSSWTQTQIYDYFQGHCEDLGCKGKDDVFGWGLIVMGEPTEEWEANELITKTKIKVNGKILEVNRILKNGENYIRLRDFEDVLDVVDVEYDAVNKLPVVED